MLTQGEATLVTAKSPEAADVMVAGKLDRGGAKKDRLVYFLATQQESNLCSRCP